MPPPFFTLALLDVGAIVPGTQNRGGLKMDAWIREHYSRTAAMYAWLAAMDMQIGNRFGMSVERVKRIAYEIREAHSWRAALWAMKDFRT